MDRKGLVIVGYQGIGKSTLAYHNPTVVDLESSNFFVDGKRADDWYIPYCNVARSLCQQGFIVCVSSHKVVRDELQRKPARRQIIVYPALSIKEQWVNKLKYRYEGDDSDKNYKAYMNAKECYEDNINELMNQEGFEHQVLDGMDYNLAEILKPY